MVLCLAGLVCMAQGQDALTGDFSSPAEINKRLAAVRAEIGALSADADPMVRERLQQLEAACQFHLVSNSVMTKARSARDQAVAATTVWRGFDPQKPPYPLLQFDTIRETMASLADSRRAAEAQVRIFTAEIEAARDQLAGHQQAERRWMEEAEHAETAAARETALRAARAEQMASRIAVENIGRLTLRLDAQRAELEIFLAQAELAGAQFRAMQGRTVLNPADVEAILRDVALRRKEVAGKLSVSIRSPGGSNPMLAWRMEFLDLQRSFWETRLTASSAADSSARKKAVAELKIMKDRVKDWEEIAKIRLAGRIPAGLELDTVQVRDAMQETGRMQRLIEFAISDLTSGREAEGWSVVDRLTSSLGALWNAELYLAEESEMVDGRKVTTLRAVTPGKLIRLAMILLIGWFLLGWLSRAVRNLVCGRGRAPSATADLASQWAFGIGLALLAVYGLNAVRIPFTALAFLGGALAIGIGFGAQTILKNFISGLILLFERPIRAGDLVEVDGITGTIRTIGMRASIVQHGNGIDSIIPNSTLLENRVTNWTLSDSLLQQSIQVGVQYGSSTREVAKILRAAAEEHGRVLKEPEPVVRFDNFGENAMIFVLVYWADIRTVSRDVLASDLRFMIEKALSEAGIDLALPQPVERSRAGTRPPRH